MAGCHAAKKPYASFSLIGVGLTGLRIFLVILPLFWLIEKAGRAA